MKTIFLIAALLLPPLSFAGPSCNWEQISKQTTATANNSKISISKYKCVIPNWDVIDEPDILRAVVIKQDGSTIKLNNDDDEFQSIKLLDLPNDFPLQVVGYSYYSASSVGSFLNLYDNHWKLVGTIHKPINEYQATNRQGSERKIVGFFKIDEHYYIERLRSLGGDCNACQKYVVETFRIVKNNLIMINTRDYDISKYKKYTFLNNS